MIPRQPAFVESNNLGILFVGKMGDIDILHTRKCFYVAGKYVEGGSQVGIAPRG